MIHKVEQTLVSILEHWRAFAARRTHSHVCLRHPPDFLSFQSILDKSFHPFLRTRTGWSDEVSIHPIDREMVKHATFEHTVKKTPECRSIANACSSWRKTGNGYFKFKVISTAPLSPSDSQHVPVRRSFDNLVRQSQSLNNLQRNIHSAAKFPNLDLKIMSNHDMTLSGFQLQWTTEWY